MMLFFVSLQPRPLIILCKLLELLLNVTLLVGEGSKNGLYIKMDDFTINEH